MTHFATRFHGGVEMYWRRYGIKCVMHYNTPSHYDPVTGTNVPGEAKTLDVWVLPQQNMTSSPSVQGQIVLSLDKSTVFWIPDSWTEYNTAKSDIEAAVAAASVTTPYIESPAGGKHYATGGAQRIYPALDDVAVIGWNQAA